MLNTMSIILLIMSLAGCTKALGYAGMHPGYIECKGKGSITGTGTLSGAAGLGASGTDTFTLQADCGDGFSLKQGPPPINPNAPIKSVDIPVK